MLVYRINMFFFALWGVSWEGSRGWNPLVQNVEVASIFRPCYNVKIDTPLERNAISCSLEGDQIAPSGVTRGLKTVAKGSLGQKVLIWGPQNEGKTITRGRGGPRGAIK